MILIYSHKLTNRLKYIFKTLFTDILEVPINFTDNIDEFEATNSPKINYSNAALKSGIYFQSTSILFDSGIHEQEINIFTHNNYSCFYRTGKESLLPFDPFAASFYLISRYEEYLPHLRDQHDRFIAKESIASQHNFLNEPLVNIWLKDIISIIQIQYPSFKFPTRKFNYLSTIDIDNAYCYKHKGFIRSIGGLLKSLLKEKDFKQRCGVIFNGNKDPFDTYDYQFQIHKKYNIKPIYFLLLADYGMNDKNISVKNSTFQSLIKKISDYYEVGIHPSYASNNNVEILTKEINRLQKITHRNVTKSRQHFLKLNLPETYQNLIDNDIFSDYTMGYAETSGFRASICSPFYFYDLDIESETKLKIYPFTVMEATYQYYKNSTPEAALNEILDLLEKVKKVDGTFISVWHNESLSDEGIWEGWKIVYEKMLMEAINNN